MYTYISSKCFKAILSLVLIPVFCYISWPFGRNLLHIGLVIYSDVWVHENGLTCAIDCDQRILPGRKVWILLCPCRESREKCQMQHFGGRKSEMNSKHVIYSGGDCVLGSISPSCRRCTVVSALGLWCCTFFANENCSAKE